MTDKLNLAISIGKAAFENPAVREAAEHATSAAERLLAETMPESVATAAKKVESLATDYFSRFDGAHHRDSPVRNLMTEIRTAGKVVMRETDGPSRIVFGEDNSVQHVLLNRSSTDIERADHLITAGFANLIHSDVLAKEAAGKVIGQSAGFISYPIERLATVEEMHRNAIDGARAYAQQDTAGANNYTKYLTERFGPRTEEQQQWSRHIVTSSGPESGWSATHVPADLDLATAGINSTQKNRAAAINPEDLRKHPSYGIKTGIFREFEAAEAIFNSDPSDPMVKLAVKLGDVPPAAALKDSNAAWKNSTPKNRAVAINPEDFRKHPSYGAKPVILREFEAAEAIFNSDPSDPMVKLAAKLGDVPPAAALKDSTAAWKNLSEAQRDRTAATSELPRDVVPDVRDPQLDSKFSQAQK